jgi:protein-glucosylgalactosylhydroxylysine glucosidase
MKKSTLVISGIVTVFAIACRQSDVTSSGIDRHALVTRHNITLTNADTMASLSVGNGEFAFTVDASGLQTFPVEYENGIPLGTQAQWAWHRVPDESHYTLADVAALYESCDDSKAPYAIQQKKGRAADATNVLRANPHRLHLGLTGLTIIKKDGTTARLNDLKNIRQHLDLWSGKIETHYTLEGVPVTVIVFGHQNQDGISAQIISPLLKEKRLGVSFRFPYGNDCHVCPGYDWENESRHSSTLLSLGNGASIKRTLDSTTYFADLRWTNGEISETKKHHFELTSNADNDSLEFTIVYSRERKPQVPAYSDTKKNSEDHWSSFWTSGGAVDFSECTDPRAHELERRVVLSQYLTRIQCSGSLPPQETGLTMNSWYGKFHLEMHWWHAAHFGFWGRPHYIDKSLSWYNTILPKAKATAEWQNYEGARWQKMTDPEGNESPSSVGAFIIWQQPHPIYLAELLYRDGNQQEVLDKYKEMVFSTADFMVSFVKEKGGVYHLCHPLIPAQEIFKATETDNPSFELQYWYHALSVAQQWRIRTGLSPDLKWQKVIDQLSPLSIRDGLYLPNSTTPNAYTDDQFRRDHPAILGAYGFLPLNDRIDTIVMKKTFEEIERKWNWESTWGWDYPMMAMTAARLNKPESAVNALLLDVQKNTYLINGHNYQDKRLRLYLPGNGGLLAAVAMMAAGWDGNTRNNPGFPANGKWNVKWEGLKKMP